MKKIVIVSIFCTAILVACQSENESENNNSAPAKSMLADENPIDGKALFQANCGACHNATKDMTGPALKGVLARVPSKEWLYSFVYNSKEVIDGGDEYANLVYEKWNKAAMTPFTQLSHEQIDAIIAYCDSQ